jgi:hypothetical protein
LVNLFNHTLIFYNGEHGDDGAEEIEMESKDHEGPREALMLWFKG